MKGTVSIINMELRGDMKLVNPVYISPANSPAAPAYMYVSMPI